MTTACNLLAELLIISPCRRQASARRSQSREQWRCQCWSRLCLTKICGSRLAAVKQNSIYYSLLPIPQVRLPLRFHAREAQGISVGKLALISGSSATITGRRPVRPLRNGSRLVASTARRNDVEYKKLGYSVAHLLQVCAQMTSRWTPALGVHAKAWYDRSPFHHGQNQNML